MRPFGRTYVAGAGGMLGEAMVATCRDRGSDVRATDLVPRSDWLGLVDVADEAAFHSDVAAFAPDLLINLAAHTDLEWCEANPEAAHASNADGAVHAGRIALELGIPLVQISTAGIFGGEQAVYGDADEPCPLTVYATTKLAGERWVAEHVPDSLVLRAGWMMGGGPSLDKKFVNKVYQQIIAGARTVYAVTDLHGSPTFTRDFAEGLWAVAGSGTTGVFNQVSHGGASRYEVACAFVEEIGLGETVEVLPVTSDHFAEEYFATRPASEQLANTGLAELGLDSMRPWRAALAEYATVFRDDLRRRTTP